MVKAVDIKAELANRPILSDRTPETPNVDGPDGPFATLSDFRDGAVYAGRFEGKSPWERHRNGDELVQILDGSVTLTILTDDGPSVLEMTGGMLTVVPKGAWHRFDAPEVVTVLTATPTPTDHSSAEDPRKDG